jgi:hypothetical protein
MNDPGRQPYSLQPESPPDPPEIAPSAGPSLTLIYSLIALALFAAIGLAMMIVIPFHHRH